MFVVLLQILFYECKTIRTIRKLYSEYLVVNALFTVAFKFVIVKFQRALTMFKYSLTLHLVLRFRLTKE